MSNPARVPEFYFDDPRLRMTALGRFLVRAVSTIGYGLAAALAVLFLLSDLRSLNMAGGLLMLFLLDRLIHLKDPARPLTYELRGRINAADALTPETYRLIESAFDRALWLGDDIRLRLFTELMEHRLVRDGLLRMDAPLRDLTAKAEERLEATRNARVPREETLEAVGAAACAAARTALEHHRRAIEPAELFAALTKEPHEPIRSLFTLFSIEPGELEYALAISRYRRALPRARDPGAVSRVFGRPRTRHRIMNRAWTARPTPMLDRMSEDLTDAARGGRGAALFGHEKEYSQLLDVLSRPGNPNALLVGEPGSGKGPIAEHLAYALTHDRVPPPLIDHRLVALEVGSILAGADEGELARRIKTILNEIVLAGNVILYIPDIHNLVKTSGAATMSGADILIPAIKGADFSVVGATYPREFKQYLEPMSDFAGSFEIIRVEEVSEADAIRYLTALVVFLEAEYRMVVSFRAVLKAVEIAHRYFRQKLLPQSAEELLKEAIANAAQKSKTALSPEDVIAEAEKRVNVPIHRAGAAEAKELLNLEVRIHERYVNQEPAVKAIAEAVREYRSGLARKGGPIAQFLFVGPTGVGKTELAKTLAAIMFGSENAMARFDMSEFQDKQSLFRFIGSPDGTARGALTDAIYEKPYSLILLDEFEKAHPDILNLFLQVFDDGRLTDNLGRTVDFQNTVIIATSNAHADILLEALRRGEPVSSVKEYLKTKLVDFFKPELLNRFSDIIVFKELVVEDLLRIAKLELGRLAATVRESQGVELTFTDSAVQEIARQSYDPVYGARPMRKIISETVRAALAEKILKGEARRASTITISFEGNVFVFQETKSP